jgi:hypothetical protein
MEGGVRALSLFSGCGAMDLAIERAGFEVVLQCEIDPARRAVLERHWPDVERVNDVTGFDARRFMAGSRARTYPWLDAALDWLAGGPDSSTSSYASLVRSLPPGFSSRTSLAFCRQTRDGTWEPYSGTWESSGTGGPTACLTLNTSEWPSTVSVCSLQEILEPDVPQKYFLSPKAAAGILRRAERRGKTLPPLLYRALCALAGQQPEATADQ